MQLKASPLRSSYGRVFSLPTPKPPCGRIIFHGNRAVHHYMASTAAVAAPAIRHCVKDVVVVYVTYVEAIVITLHNNPDENMEKQKRK